MPIIVHLLLVSTDRSGEGRGGKPDGFTFSFHTLLFVLPTLKEKRRLSSILSHEENEGKSTRGKKRTSRYETLIVDKYYFLVGGKGTLS
jgi:hypothetical protein